MEKTEILKNITKTKIVNIIICEYESCEWMYDRMLKKGDEESAKRYVHGKHSIAYILMDIFKCSYMELEENIKIYKESL